MGRSPPNKELPRQPRYDQPPWNTLLDYPPNHPPLTTTGVTDINGVDLRCPQMSPGKSTATVVAGEKLGFIANAQVTYFGPVSFYMARVPDSANINTWDGSGNVWAKVAATDAVKTASGGDWPADSMCFMSSFMMMVWVC